MKKFWVLFSAFMLLFGLSGVAGAYTIEYSNTPVGNEFTSPYASLTGFITEDFNSYPTTTFTWSGDGQIINASISGQAAAPAGVGGVPDASYFVSVPTNTATPNTFTATNLGGTFNYFGIWWGSVDEYNTLSFYNGATLVETITGPQAINPGVANGNQTAPGENLYVNIHNLPSFDSFSMSSDQFAFETDNITVGVPEPTTLILLGSGLLGLAGLRRKFKK